jgi:prepilin-type N-terminal cleavage/methylation domain-containing protein
MENCRGFTLVETIVTMIILLVLAAGLWTLFSFFNLRTIEDTALSRLQMQYDNVSVQIGMNARQAGAVVALPQEWPVGGGLNALAGTEVYMLNDSGVVFGGYRITGNILQEYVEGVNGMEWINYIAGSTGPVETTENSAFSLSPNRKNISITLTLKTSINGKVFQLGSRGDCYICRN